MGYNDHSQAPTSGFDNIQKTVDFLRSKGVSDVRVILTKGKGNPYGVNPNFEQDMKQLSDRLRNELTGAKIIPNNGKISSDGIHFFGSYKKIYNDACGATTTKYTFSLLVALLHQDYHWYFNCSTKYYALLKIFWNVQYECCSNDGYMSWGSNFSKFVSHFKDMA